MTRFARPVVPGVPVHIVHRGNRRGPVFFDDRDRERYLATLGRYARRYGLELWAYCLMSNHVHLIGVARGPLSLARAIGNTHRAHAVRINRRNGWSGHLWENRFYSTLLDEQHLWSAVRYVERNPLRAGLVAAAQEWPWSSARAHCGWLADALLAPERPFPGAMDRWTDWLNAELEEEADLARLRANTRTGRPSGGQDFVAGLERAVGRRLRALRRGRPPGDTAGSSAGKSGTG